jgi:hypothetical protein
MNTFIIGGLALVALLLASLLGDSRRRALVRRRRRALAQTLRDLLELLQLLQKHRGLGGQTAPAAQQQRQAVARHLDQLWEQWPETGLGPALPRAWPALKSQPENFAAHSRVIEDLISAIALAEQRLRALYAEPGSARPGAAGIAEACHRLEDLARLRGLAARAAAQPQCPLDLQVQLRYLCQRLQKNTAGPQRARIGQVLAIIADKLLDTERVAISPASCFELITPIIDDGVKALQRQMAL